MSLATSYSPTLHKDTRLCRSTPQSPATSQPPILPPATNPRARKTITLLSGSARLLPKLSPKVSTQASAKLSALGVHVVHGIRSVGATTNADGTTNCVLNNDMTLTADLVTEATGVYPNTRYLSSAMLDEAGYVVTDPEDLRVYGPDVGERVYAVGDCASYSKNYTLEIYEAVPVLMRNLANDLLSHEYRLQAVAGGGSPGEAAKRSEMLRDARLVQNPTNSLLIPITRYGGVGVVFDFKLPSLMVHVLKGRDYKLGKVGSVVREGKNPYPGGKEKVTEAQR